MLLANETILLNHMDFALWGYLKSRVYSVKVTDLEHHKL
jgi:hypothetical protein